MRLWRRSCVVGSLALLALPLLAGRAHADTLTIKSSPSGATVEIDGLAAGTTPYQIHYPGGYFHKTHTVFGARLEHSMTLRISKDGYLAQKITLTDGPFEWVAINGRHRGNYFLLKTAHFDIKLDPISFGDGSPAETIGRDGPMHPVSAAAFDADEREAQGETGNVAIASEPAGADIYVDGRFVGQTPSTIRLGSGSHHIEVKSRNKQIWQRDLDVSKGSQLTLHAVLDPAP
jgi:hypothetical protein